MHLRELVILINPIQYIIIMEFAHTCRPIDINDKFVNLSKTT